MAAASSEVLALCALLCALVADSSAEGRNGGPLCVDGTYEHGGRLCCLCSAGQHLKEHCTANLQYGVCEHCPPQTYSIQPNNLKSCEPCSSCSPNANLEVKEACTPARDTKCGCKTDHYCKSQGTVEKCRKCSPCEVCPEGIKVACTANNNTVCEDKMGGGTIAGIIIFLVLLLCAIGLVLFLYYRTKNRKKKQNNGSEAEMEALKAQDVDLLRHLPGIAKIVEWDDMKEVATRSKIQDLVIKSCEQEHPNDSQEKTLHLLKIWEERQGKEASKMLVKILEENKKRGKAEKIIEQLSKPPA
ncbi:tumor necrosis factor receptor superfamily member 6-like [Pungitius pungitius]|uniref:tumor necrosis factor receptor superfamily member 6-like n=1 Tax=Pungitius pungitius TaxID=134920 RepID=UPI002E154A82